PFSRQSGTNMEAQLLFRLPSDAPRETIPSVTHVPDPSIVTDVRSIGRWVPNRTGMWQSRRGRQAYQRIGYSCMEAGRASVYQVLSRREERERVHLTVGPRTRMATRTAGTKV